MSAILLAVVMLMWPPDFLVGVVEYPTRTAYLYELPIGTGYIDMSTNCHIVFVGGWFGNPKSPALVRGQNVGYHRVVPTFSGLPWDVITYNSPPHQLAVVVDGYGQTKPGVVGLCQKSGACWAQPFMPVPACPMNYMPFVSRETI